MARTLIVSDRHNSFFSANNIKVGSQIPTEGDYVKGDIIVNIGENTATEAMWICVESGNPGVWEVVGAGAGASDKLVVDSKMTCKTNHVVIENACNEVEIGIEGFNAVNDTMLVFKNGVIMVEGVEYNVSEDNTKIISINEVWNESNVENYGITFVVFKEVVIYNGENGSITMDMLGNDVKDTINGLVTITELNASNIDKNTEAISKIDLSGYATKEDLTKIDLSDYATKEDLENVEVDLSPYQEKNSNSLATSAKDIVGAINEVFQSGNNVKQNLVDALIAKGVSCSTSDSFSKLISLIYGLTYDTGDTDNENLPSFEGENTWATCKNMRVNRFALTSAVVDKKIYVIGGYNTGYCNNLEIYDTELGTWEDGPNMPSVLAYASAEAIDGKIYVIGGSNNTQAVGTPDNDTILLATGKYRVFDTLLGTWSEISKKLMIHQYGETTGTSTAVIGNTIYFAGGHSEGARYNTIGAFNVETNTTTVLGDQYGGMQNTGMAHSALCAVNNKLYRFGGKGYGTNSLNNTSGSNYVITYDPTNPTADSIWLEQGMPVSMHSMGYCVVNEKVYLIGGISGSGTFYNSTGGMSGTVQNSVYEYNPYTNKWTKVNTMLTPRFGHTLAVVDNVIYCIGGADSNKVPLNSMEVYCPPGIEPPVFSSGDEGGNAILLASELPEEVVEGQVVLIPKTETVLPVVITDKLIMNPTVDTEINVGTTTAANDFIYKPIIDDVKLTYYLDSAVQFNNNIMNPIDGYLGKDGAWKQFSRESIILYMNGNDYEGLAGASSINSNSNYTGYYINTVNKNNMLNVNTNMGSDIYAYVAYKKPYDLSNYSKLEVTYVAGERYDLNYFNFGFSKSYELDEVALQVFVSIEEGDVTTTPQTKSVDLSLAEGIHYFAIQGRASSSSPYELNIISIVLS